MTDEEKRVFVRLGPLYRHVAKYAKQEGLNMSAAARRLIAKALKVEEPELPQGVAALGKRAFKAHQRRAIESRWANQKDE